MFGWIARSALPTPGFVDWLFDRTRTLLGMKDWPCALVPHEDAPTTKELLGAGVPYAGERSGGAAGTFSMTADGPRITWSPEIVRDPEGFIATMAHELSHYILQGVESEPPGGAEAEEPATDVCAVLLGFGVFLANNAFTFEQHQDGVMQGWSAVRRGYLDEMQLAHALAIHLELNGTPESVARPWLRDNPPADLKHALRDVRKHRVEDMRMLRALRGPVAAP